MDPPGRESGAPEDGLEWDAEDLWDPQGVLPDHPSNPSMCSLGFEG